MKDALQSVVPGSAQCVEVRLELVLQQRLAQPALEPQALAVSRLLADVVPVPLAQARPAVRSAPPVSPERPQLQDALPVGEVQRGREVLWALQVSPPRALAQRPPERPVASAQAWPVPSLPLRPLLLLPQRHAIAVGPFRRLQQGWSSSESFSRLRQSPAKDQ